MFIHRETISPVAIITVRHHSFHGRVLASPQGQVLIPLPFEPSKTWGKRDKYHVAGTIDGESIRGVAVPGGTGFVVFLGPAWRRDHGVSPGDLVKVTLGLEGPQQDGLAPDVAAALTHTPEAAQFWDSVAQFYRKAYLRWIDATKKRPEERAKRIAEMIRLLKAGRKER